MHKDQMTHGAGTWIYFPRPSEIETRVTRIQPWESTWNKDDQLAPVDDMCGVALFRKQFCVEGLSSARVDVTSLGVFDLWCNGHRVGRKDETGETVYDEMKPGWTDYRHRVLYYSYDLAPYLKEGQNTLLCAVAPGWWNGRIAVQTYGEDNHVAMLAAIRLQDSKAERVFYTDDSWQGAWGGAVRASDIWDGERYDANFPTYQTLSEDGSCISWGAVSTETHDIYVTAHIGPTVMVRPHLTRKPESIVIYNGTEDNGSEHGRIHVVCRSAGESFFKLCKGEKAVVDLGQNMVGWPVFTVKGPKCTEMVIRMGEMLNDSGLESRGNDNPEGSIYSLNYRSAKSKLHYILKGDPNGESYRPTFTFFGFRYLEFCATEEVELTELSCMVVNSIAHETGKMETSHPMVNQLISNIRWGQLSNYLSVPTDCPQRDERLGWTCDTQVFCRTAAYNADVNAFFHKWLQDLRDSQNEEGAYPDVAPWVRVVRFGNGAWADAGIIVPYMIWKMYADTSIIETHYASMVKYMDWLASCDPQSISSRYADWLAYEPTSKTLFSTAYYAMDCRYMVAMSRAIGKKAQAESYEEQYNKVRTHFRATYCDEQGELLPEHRTQCAYLLFLQVGLVDEEKRASNVAALKQKIIDNGYKLSTGFLGTCILCPVLADNGENDLAYSLLLQTENPSWLYSIYQGATTIWERWDSYTTATGFGNVRMNSFNHYAYGAVQEWMYRHVAGIETTEDAPGFAHPILQPKPDTRTPEQLPPEQERIRWVKTSFESRTGLIVSNWDTTDGFVYECTVPVASTLYLPVLSEAETYTVNGAVKRFADEKLCRGGKCLEIELEAGSYIFIQK